MQITPMTILFFSKFISYLQFSFILNQPINISGPFINFNFPFFNQLIDLKFCVN